MRIERHKISTRKHTTPVLANKKPSAARLLLTGVPPIPSPTYRPETSAKTSWRATIHESPPNRQPQQEPRTVAMPLQDPGTARSDPQTYEAPQWRELYQEPRRRISNTSSPTASLDQNATPIKRRGTTIFTTSHQHETFPRKNAHQPPEPHY